MLFVSKWWQLCSNDATLWFQCNKRLY